MLFLVGLGFLVTLRAINVFVFDWLIRKWEAFSLVNPRTYKQIRTPIVVQGGRGREAEWNTSPEFLICCSISKSNFAFSGRPLIFLTR